MLVQEAICRGGMGAIGDGVAASRSMEVGNVERLLRRESYKDEQAIKMQAID